MSATPPPPVGSVVWLDLTSNNAPQLREFYSQVVGWNAEGLSMGDYSDFVMSSPDDGVSCAGICHARGVNADLPPVWLAYVVVADLAQSLTHCRASGGEVLVDARVTQGGSYAVIRDPAGACLALYQSEKVD